MQASTRAVWEQHEEKTLLTLFEKARQDPEMRTDRGVKPHGWDKLAQEMNQKCSSNVNVDQLKSKCSRLMMDYELFEDVGGDRSLTDQDWDRVIRGMPEYAARLQRFKEAGGFPYVDICRRIALGKAEGTPAAMSSKIKRSGQADEELPEAKRTCIEVEHDTSEWDLHDEKLLLFLCWRAKHNQEMLANEGIQPETWLEVTKDLNEHGKTRFSKKEVEAKYLQLMVSYVRFKQVTGFSGAMETVPKCDLDWDQLVQERPSFSLELENLKKQGGFPHVEVCSLISGDAVANGTEPATVEDFLKMGVLQHQPGAGSAVITSQSVGNNVTSAQVAKPAHNLSYLLPATSSSPATASKNLEPAVASSQANDVASSILTQDVNENLSAFLKTATAYLVMLITEHNQGSGD